MTLSDQSDLVLLHSMVSIERRAFDVVFFCLKYLMDAHNTYSGLPVAPPISLYNVQAFPSIFRRETYPLCPRWFQEPHWCCR